MTNQKNYGTIKTRYRVAPNARKVLIMPELKQAEKMAKVREQVRDTISLPENAVQIGTDTYVMETKFGYGKVVISAIKDADYDVAEARADYEFKLAEAKTKADKRKAEAEAKKAANLAKKAAKAKAEEA